MASSVHPFQPYPGDGSNHPPQLVGGYGTPGSVAPPPGSGVVYAYGAPNSPGFAFGAPGYHGYAYGAPSPAGYMTSAPPSQYPPVGATNPLGTAGTVPGYGYAASAAVYPAPGAGSSWIIGNPIGGGGGGGGEGDHNKGFAGGQPLNTNQQQQTPVNPRDQIQTNRWAAGLFSCCDNCVPNCALSTCLSFVPLAQIYARLGLMAYRTALVLFFCFYMSAMLANVSTSGKTTKHKTGSRLRTSYTSSNSSTPAPKASVLALVTAGVIGQLALRIFVWRARAVIRKRYKIPGSACGDCCTAYWCSCCAIAQMATHVKSYTPGSCITGAPDVLPAYTPS